MNRLHSLEIDSKYHRSDEFLQFPSSFFKLQMSYDAVVVSISIIYFFVKEFYSMNEWFYSIYYLLVVVVLSLVKLELATETRDSSLR